MNHQDFLKKLIKIEKVFNLSLVILNRLNLMIVGFF